MINKSSLAAFGAALTMAFALSPSNAAGQEISARDVLKTYADIALAGYEDSLVTARALDTAVGDLLSDPNAETLAAAREAWLAARVPYQ